MPAKTAVKPKSVIQDFVAWVRAITEPNRLLIIGSLLKGDKNGREIAIDTGLSYMNVHHHLIALKRHEVVVRTGDDRNGKYTLAYHNHQMFSITFFHESGRSIDLVPEDLQGVYS